jgi:hypothetical protein
MKNSFYLLLFVFLLVPAKNIHAGERGFDYPLQEVAFYNIKVTGGLWKMRIDSCI